MNIIDQKKNNSEGAEVFHKNVSALLAHVEKRVSNLLPENFRVLTDKLNRLDEQFLSIYVTFSRYTELEFASVLLTFSVMKLKMELESRPFQLSYLSCFGNFADNIVQLVEESRSKNKPVARLLVLRFVECASHLFNLAVNRIFFALINAMISVYVVIKKLFVAIFALSLMYTQIWDVGRVALICGVQFMSCFNNTENSDWNRALYAYQKLLK